MTRTDAVAPTQATNAPAEDWHLRNAPARPPTLSGWVWFCAWVLSRAVMAWIFATSATFIAFDVRYYFWGVNGAASLVGRLVEYPVPVVWLLGLLRGISGPSEDIYIWVFTAFICLLDLAMTLLLWHTMNRRTAIYWATFTFLIGPLLWYRIDLIPAVLVALAMLWMNRHPRMSGAMVALGAATKLWPAMLIAPLLGIDPPARRRGRSFLVVGVGLALGSWLTEGWDRSISPLSWQSARGLQIESVAATWPMLVRAFGPHPSYQVHLSQFNAWEIYGPGVHQLTLFADRAIFATVLLVAFLSWLIGLGGFGLPGHSMQAARSPQRQQVRTQAMLLSVLAIICAVLITNKTFSPQYMIWLAGPLAILGTMHLPRPYAHQLHFLAGLGLVAAGLTQLVFPLNYGGLIYGATADILPTLLLVTRNVVVLAMAAQSLTLAVRLGWLVGRSSEGQNAS